MYYFSTFIRLLWHRLLNWQMFTTLFIFVILYQFVLRNHAFLDLIGRLIKKVEIRISGNYESLSEHGRILVNDNKTRASWELRKGQASVYAVQGRRPQMEDRFNVVSDLPYISLFGVFDGHGGNFASDFVEKSIFKAILIRLLQSLQHEKKEIKNSIERAESNENMEFIRGKIEKILIEEILNVDKALLEIQKETGDISGSTLLVATLHGYELVIANVGDSRGVLCDQYNDVIPLSFDHKPQLATERKRIKEAGGFVSFNGVWRVAGILATSRALGDLPLKEKGFIIADPEVLKFDLRKFKPKFMILATDGLWDVFTNEEAVAFINSKLGEEDYGVKSLVLQAYYRGSLDNISAIVVKFNFESNERFNLDKSLVKISRKGYKEEKICADNNKVSVEIMTINDSGDRSDEKEFSGGGKVLGVDNVEEYEDDSVIFKEKDLSSLVHTSISEEVKAEIMKNPCEREGDLLKPNEMKRINLYNTDATKNFITTDQNTKKSFKKKNYEINSEETTRNNLKVFQRLSIHEALKITSETTALEPSQKVSVQTLNWNKNSQEECKAT